MSDTKKKDPFPQTKDLVRIALNDGMTQMEIANLCRTQQGQVSKWRNGERLAGKAQIKPLLEIYGDLLFRVPFKVYQTFSASNNEAQFLRVEGKLILREKFRKQSVSNTSKNPITAFRLSIHQQGEDQFYLIGEATAAPYPGKDSPASAEPFVTDRLAAWYLHNFLERPNQRLNLKELRQVVQNVALGEMQGYFPSLRQLPYLVTETLLNQGVKPGDLEGLVEIKLPE
ncbi:hypothetical protein [Ruegeria arenilitoris]|uniref:hypothetical protein n=1 Tax=Ruegeria arenilitoris TaxID=1173585 RepID=UPI0014813E7B|nr:hypothetical protein [Ruegeria arenilitoris]